MKLKVWRATVAQLDWLVTDLVYTKMLLSGEHLKYWGLKDHLLGLGARPYTSDWLWGGELINSEKISTTCDDSGVWLAYYAYNYGGERQYMNSDHRQLVAAMRSYVGANWGKEVHIPDSLKDR